MSAKKQTLEYYTVGIRYCTNPTHMHTYRIRKGAKVKLGDEVVLDNALGTSVGFVCRIDATRQDVESGIEYKYITRKVAPL